MVKQKKLACFNFNYTTPTVNLKNTNMIPRALLISIFILYTGLISYLSLSPMDGSPSIHIWDKAAHAIAYIGFAIQSCMIANNNRQLFLLFFLCFVFGITIELLQGLTSYRFASWEDQVANTIGLFIGYFILITTKRFLPLKGILVFRKKTLSD